MWGKLLVIFEMKALVWNEAIETRHLIWSDFAQLRLKISIIFHLHYVSVVISALSLSGLVSIKPTQQHLWTSTVMCSIILHLIFLTKTGYLRLGVSISMAFSRKYFLLKASQCECWFGYQTLPKHVFGLWNIARDGSWLLCIQIGNLMHLVDLVWIVFALCCCHSGQEQMFEQLSFNLHYVLQQQGLLFDTYTKSGKTNSYIFWLRTGTCFKKLGNIQMRTIIGVVCFYTKNADVWKKDSSKKSRRRL